MSPDLQTSKVRTPSLTTLVQQSAWQDAIVAAARAQLKQLPENCAAAKFKPTGELIVYAPAEFEPDGTLSGGVWNERVDVTGCNAPIRLNILTVLQPGGAPSRIPTMPGDTRADPATQKNALGYAQAVAIRYMTAMQPGCRQQVFTNTQFDGYTGLPIAEIQNGRPNRAWRENWMLFACGQTYSITITFTPNAKGLQLSATNPTKRG
uniref:hypothetical protein n=1 Tax=Acidisphaera sp. L21 TaxID=1641851 RepID=UPI00131DD00E